MAFAGWVHRLGPLIVAVNKVGSLFYGSLLGCFVLALFFRRVRGTAAFVGMLAGEAAILATAAFSGISWLWYNVIGCAVVVLTALAVTAVAPPGLMWGRLSTCGGLSTRPASEARLPARPTGP